MKKPKKRYFEKPSAKVLEFEKLAAGVTFERVKGSGKVVTIREMKNREVVECYRELKTQDEVDDRLMGTLIYEIRRRNIRMVPEKIKAIDKVKKKVEVVEKYAKKIEEL